MPTEDALVKGLRRVIAAAWNGPDRDSITVNSMRARAEDALKLGSGFFSDGKWKSRSKEIIKEECDRLTDLDNHTTATPSSPRPQIQSAARKSNGHGKVPEKDKKRAAATTVKAPPRKRQKRQETVTDEDADLSAVEICSDTSGSEAGSGSSQGRETNASKRKNGGKGTNKSGVRRKASSDEVVDSDSEVEEDQDSVVTVKSTSNSNPNAATKEVQPETNNTTDDEKGKIDKTTAAGAALEASDSDTSLLSDAPAQPKRPKSKTTKPSKPSSKSTTSTSSKARPNSKSTTNSTLTPLEQDLKTLQSQLKKCGLNKIWAFELKHFGDDTASKVRHLRALLREIGVEGRFSEAKAKEIKERRELMADVDALQNSAHDGVGDLDAPRQRRSRAAAVSSRSNGRSKTKVKANGSRGRGSGSEDDEDEEENDGEGGARSGDGDEDDGDEYVAPVQAMVARAKQDLAFLGDDDIDSDD